MFKPTIVQRRKLILESIFSAAAQALLWRVCAGPAAQAHHCFRPLGSPLRGAWLTSWWRGAQTVGDVAAALLACDSVKTQLPLLNHSACVRALHHKRGSEVVWYCACTSLSPALYPPQEAAHALQLPSSPRRPSHHCRCAMHFGRGTLNKSTFQLPGHSSPRPVSTHAACTTRPAPLNAQNRPNQLATVLLLRPSCFALHTQHTRKCTDTSSHAPQPATT